MKAPGNHTIYLKDYKSPHFRIDTVELDFNLFELHCVVVNRMRIHRDNKSPHQQDLELNGEDLQLISVLLDGQKLEANRYKATPDLLTIYNPPNEFTIEVTTEIKPHLNTELQGLYKSGAMFCTQNEPEGFRRITYYLDRPDIMAVYTTRIEAQADLYPVLLSNGNRVDQGILPNGRHWVKWHDPFKKPSYLFALVAGDLGKISDSFTTASGRHVQLEIYVNHGNEARCSHAMDSLKRSMRWDEERFGLEYDLDIFMIVAVDDFNSGAMENKGLNIFNSKYILADALVATDTDYEQIEGVVAHEYFHNWTGNRVTCRDWFQLSLKEGLTVFRDQEFSADMGAAAVRRMNEVMRLRTFQFAEDSGPMAHPIRPTSYMEINNFYTMTVYEKGSEVIRMIQTLVGREGFRKGIAKYFALYDGQAVTTEDFVQAMETANNIDLTQFKNWYDQAGTPLLEVSSHYDSQAQKFSLTFQQSCRPTPETKGEKKPFHIPVRVGLLSAKGEDLIGSRVLNMTEAKQTFTFENISSKPVPSVLRGFSAPVNLKIDLSDDDLLFLMAHDTDLFNRWDASQQIIHRLMLKWIAQLKHGENLVFPQALGDAFQKLMGEAQLDPAFKARVLTLPAESVYQQMMTPVDPEAIHEARTFLARSLSQHLTDDLKRFYQSPIQKAQGYAVEVAGQRSLRNQALSLLCASANSEALKWAYDQLTNATNMTDEMAALSSLALSESPDRQKGIDAFYEKWKHEPLVINKWLQVQASVPRTSTLADMRALVAHAGFDFRNPNKVYALLVTFGRDNLFGFHASHECYEFMADQILKLDALNPQVASRVAAAFNYWRLFDEKRQAQMKAQLERIRNTPQLSKNVYEIVSKTLTI